MPKGNLRIILFTIFYLLIIKSGYVKWMDIWVIDPVFIGFGGLGALFVLKPGFLPINRKIQVVLLTLLVFISWILFSCIYTPSQEVYKLKFIKTILVLILFFIPLFFTRSKDDFKYIIPAYNIFALGASLIILKLYFTGQMEFVINTDPNDDNLAPNYLSLSVLFCSTLMLNLNKEGIWFNLFKILMFLCMIICGGRGPLLVGTLMIITFYTYQYRHKFKWLITIYGFFFLLGTFLLSWEGSQRTLLRFSDIESVDGNRSFDSRTYFLKESTKRIFEKPVFGTGYGSFSRELTGKDIINTPHSMFLEIGFETGIPGMIILTCFYILMLKLMLSLPYFSLMRQDRITLNGMSLLIIYFFLTSSFSLYLMNSKDLFAISGCFLALLNAHLHELKYSISQSYYVESNELVTN